VSDEEPQKPGVFDALRKLDDRPKPPPRQPIPQSSSGPNFNPTIEDPRTRGAVKAAFKHSFDNIVNAAANGIGRNETLNTEAFNLGQLIENRLVTVEQVEQHLLGACAASGLLADDGQAQCEASMRGGIAAGRASGPRTNLPKMEPQVAGPRGRIPVSGPDEEESAGEAPRADGRGTGPAARILTMRSMADVQLRIPDWAWHYRGAGRIQLGTLAIFGGLPGSGKSTAARWFVSEITQGRLEGCWYENPQNCAYIAAEEEVDAMVAPSLVAADADLSRIFYPEVTMGDKEAQFLSRADEEQLTEQMLDLKVKMLVVDPIMSTLGGSVDIHKNNEVREYLDPYIRIAHAIDGIVIGIAHFRKNGAANAVQALTGSAAFGEVTRSVFAFAKASSVNDDEDVRVMSQSKNSAGREDLAMQYALDLVPVQAHDGRTTEMTRFQFTGTSDVTVEDLMAEGAEVRTKVDDASTWLSDYLLMNGPTASKKVKDDARKDTDFSEPTLKRAVSKLRLIVENRSEAGKPRVTYWRLPSDEVVEARHWTDEIEPE